jgi:hypothetical protein
VALACCYMHTDVNSFCTASCKITSEFPFTVWQRKGLTFGWIHHLLMQPLPTPISLPVKNILGVLGIKPKVRVRSMITPMFSLADPLGCIDYPLSLWQRQ